MSPLEIHLSSSAGFCWGVERALRKAREAAAGTEGPVHTLGPLIHNPAVIAELAEQGIDVLDAVAEDTAGTVIIRSHGVTREVSEQLARRAVDVIDATCTFVKRAQEKAADLHEQGYLVVVLGEPRHPEVLAIRSYAGPDAVVVQSAADLPAELPRRVGVVVQTTQSRESLAGLVAALAPRVSQLLVHNTICDATQKRQEAALALAAAVDTVVVVGGRSSANTARLAELCAAVQPRTHHVQTAGELEPGWFIEAGSVGVTAGASTPPEQIQEVVERLREMVP